MPADTLTFEIVSPEVGLPYCISDVDGLRVGWDMCGGCGQHIINCTHDVPIEPSYVRATPGTGVGSDYRYAGELSAPFTTRRPKGINVMDLVDRDLVDKIKTASEDRSANDS